MRLIKRGRHYFWEEHDSLIITPQKNFFYWFSRNRGGGTVQLVREINKCSVEAAVEYLVNLDTAIYIKIDEPEKKEFKYLMKEHHDQTESHNYLINQRKLSKETVDYFFSKNLLAQGTYKDKELGHDETVIIFKHEDLENSIKSISFQGIYEFEEIHAPRKRLKKVYGDGLYGWLVFIGKPSLKKDISNERPLKIIVFESAIDLMSYYELKKDCLKDLVLLSMNGLKKSIVSVFIAEALGVQIEDKENYLDSLNELGQQRGIIFEMIQLTFALDNDERALEFIEKLCLPSFNIKTDLPFADDKEKMDWNNIIQNKKSV